MEFDIQYTKSRKQKMKALLVVDMQNGFLKDDNYKSVSKKVEELANSKLYDKIFFTKFINDKSKNSFFEDKNNWNGLETKQEQDFCIKIPKNAIVFEKYGYCLQQKDLEYIKSQNISEIDVCGFKTEACIYAISFQLWDAMVYPNILINYSFGNVDMGKIFLCQFGNIDKRK